MEQPGKLSTKNRRLGVTPASLATVLTRPTMMGILCLAALARMWTIADVLPARATQWDFSIYYMSAMAVREGLNPYKTDFGPLGESLGLEVGEIHHATDPPTFLLLMEPFAAMRERTAFYIWVGLNAILLAAALALLFGKSSGLGGSGGLALAALAVMYPPVYYHFFLAQSKIPILLLLIMMMKCMEREWDRAAGLCLAFAGLLRMFPLLLIGYLAIQRRWRVLLWTFIGLAIGTLVTIAALGVRDWLSFRQGIALLNSERWLSMSANFALAAAVSRLFWVIAGSELSSTIEFMRWATIAAVDAALLGSTIWVTLKLGTETRSGLARALHVDRRIGVAFSDGRDSLHGIVLHPVRPDCGRGQPLPRKPARPMADNSRLYYDLYNHAFACDSVCRPMERKVVAAVLESLFLATMLIYLASYWFTVEATQLAPIAAAGQEDAGILPGMLQERR